MLQLHAQAPVKVVAGMGLAGWPSQQQRCFMRPGASLAHLGHSTSGLPRPRLLARRVAWRQPPPSPRRSTTIASALPTAPLDVAEGLPIAACLQQILDGLSDSSSMVLQAPPGAGKTTAVPLALLLQQPEWLAGKQGGVGWRLGRAGAVAACMLCRPAALHMCSAL